MKEFLSQIRLPFLYFFKIALYVEATKHCNMECAGLLLALIVVRGVTSPAPHVHRSS